MKKKLITLVIIAMAAVLMPFKSHAQGLGGLLKKGKETLEKISQASGTTSTTNAAQSSSVKEKGAAMKFDNGIEMLNPMSEYMDVTPIGLYGVPTSENYGNVYLVVKVMMKEPANWAGFGGVGNDKMVAVDANGKVYTGASGTLNFDTPEGIPVQVIMNQPQLMFEGVKKNITEMPMVKFGIFIDANHKGMLTLKNVPINWDESLE